MMAEMIDELREFIASRMREGFVSVHEIVENATGYAEDKFGQADVDVRPVIRRLTAEALAMHRAAQAEWASPTDCDRLDEAFAALNRQGVVARQDFSCCNNCGFAEIWDEIEEEEQRQPAEGYVFYHLQCTEQAIETGRLLMAYGSVYEDPEALVRVARRVGEELRRVGLKTSWAGTSGDPIVVDEVVWRRRRGSRGRGQNR